MRVCATLKSTGHAAVLALLTTGCTQQSHVFESAAMMPSIQPGEEVVVDYLAYAHQAPARWDVVVFRPAANSDVIWALRVVGLPGETLTIEDGLLLVDGQRLDPPARLKDVENLLAVGTSTNNYAVAFPYRVANEEFFLLGDNIGSAVDSRVLGPYHRSSILGRVVGK